MQPVRLALIALMLPFAAAAQSAAPLADGSLITPQEAVEYGGARGFDEVSEVRMRGAAPVIRVLAPEPAGDLKVKAPFPIKVLFEPLGDAAIVPSTFKLLYGFVKLDITSRISQFVQITSTGFALDNAKIPKGKHKLVLQVEDEKQRVAERELRVEVE
jgi:hypothetical protein